MDPDSSYKLIVLVCFLVLSSFLCTMESALRSINRGRLRHLISEFNTKAILVNKLLQKGKLFDSILILEVLLVLGTGAVLYSLATDLWDGQWMKILALLIFAAVFAVFAKILPEAAGQRQPERFAFFLARPLQILIVIFYPLLAVVAFLAGVFYSLKGIEPPSQEAPVIEDEIINLVAAGQEVGIIQPDEKTMIHGVFDFTDTVVRDVMVPRPDIIAVEKNSSYAELLEVIQREQFSRIPVYEGNIDNILGVVHIKDLIMAGARKDSAFALTSYLRQPFFVPETKKVNELFRAMKKEKVHMAVVLDEYGGTAGLVTLEDLIEEIMGEIQDEHDTEEPDLRKIEPYVFEVNAGIRIEDLNEKLGLNLENGEAETLGGLVFAELDRVPVQGDRVLLQDVALTVQQMDGHRIEKLRLTKEKAVDKGQSA